MKINEPSNAYLRLALYAGVSIRREPILSPSDFWLAASNTEIEKGKEDKQDIKKFKTPKIIKDFVSVSYGVNTKYQSGSMNIYFSDGYREISLTVAKYADLTSIIYKAKDTKKLQTTFTVLDKYKVPSEKSNYYVSKFVKVAYLDHEKVKADDKMNQGGGRILLTQSRFTINENNIHEFIMEDEYGIRISIKDYLDAGKYIHPTGKGIEEVEDSGEIDF